MKKSRLKALVKLIWRAGRLDFCLSLPILPIYSACEVALALLSGILIQIILHPAESMSLHALLPKNLSPFFPLDIIYHGEELIYLIPCLIVLVGFLKMLFAFFSNYFIERSGHRVACYLREELLKQHLMSSGNEFDAKNPDALANQLMQDTSLLQSAVGKGTISAFRDAIVLCGIVLTMMFISWRISLVVFLIFLGIGFLLKRVSTKIHYFSKEGQKKQIDLSTRVLSSFHGTLAIHALRSQAREFADFQKQNKENYDFMYSSLFTRTFFSSATEFLGLFLLAVTLWWHLNHLSALPGSVYASILVLMAFSFRYIKNIANTITFFTEISVVIERISQHLIQKTERLVHKPLAPRSSHVALETRNVSYASAEGELILKNCNVAIPRGTKTLIMGDSGSGKTTFLRLLCGLLLPTQGEVACEPDCLLTTQTPYTFRGSVRENILYTRQDFLSKAEDLVCNLSLAFSPSGAQLFLEKRLGFLGEGLSGGEKARVALARALFASPKLLLLDEPTANLDQASSQLFWEAVWRWHALDADRTVVVISHVPIDHPFDIQLKFEGGHITQVNDPKNESSGRSAPSSGVTHT